MNIQTLLDRQEYFAVNSLIKVLNVRKFSEEELDQLIEQLRPHGDYLPNFKSLVRLRNNYSILGTF